MAKKTSEPIALAVIGGSGVYNIEALTDVNEVRIKTPFGDPSDAIILGTLNGVRVAFSAPFQHGLHILIISFKCCLNTAIVEISHPSCQFQSDGSLLGICPEKNTLYPAGDDNVHPLHSCHSLPVSFRNSFSLMILMPESLAFSSFEPGDSPATT